MPPVASPDTTCWMKTSMEAVQYPRYERRMASSLNSEGGSAPLPRPPPRNRCAGKAGARTAMSDRLCRQAASRLIIACRVHSPGAEISLMMRLVAQVRAPDGVVFLELRRRPRHHDPPRLEQVGVVGELERGGRVLLDEQHAHAFLTVDRAHDAEDCPHHQRRQPQARLIDE